MIFETMKRARGRGITTAFAVRGFGYDDPRHFADVDHAFMCSPYLTGVYRDKVGLLSTPIEPPIDWSTVVAPAESRAFLTFVHPAPHKGLLLFARLADMLGSRRPDIPCPGRAIGPQRRALNAMPGIEFGNTRRSWRRRLCPSGRRLLRADAGRCSCLPCGTSRSAASPPRR